MARRAIDGANASIRLTSPGGPPRICATDTQFFDDAGRIIRQVIKTEGDPCDDAQDYRKSAKGVDKTFNGPRTHGNVTDDYREGILLERTIVYDPPKKP